jgi:hypothetical protein
VGGGGGHWWTLEQVWMCCREDKVLFPWPETNSDSSVSQLMEANHDGDDNPALSSKQHAMK